MALSEIIKLGDPLLLEKAQPVEEGETEQLMPVIEKMWRLIAEFRQAYGRGRAMAAPQAGLSKRIICLNAGSPMAMINPVVQKKSDEMMEIWDDCMSFPNLMVRLRRHRRITVSFFDLQMRKHTWDLEDDMSELLQHELDHLDGILAISKAEDISCFRWVD